MRSLSVLFLFLISGCATTYKDFNASKVKVGEGVSIGRVSVVYNGAPFNKECEICLSSGGGPCQSLTEEGLIFLNVKIGNSSLRRINCKDHSIHHYTIEDATYTQSEGVTYFGEVKLEWTNEGGFKATDMFGLVGAAISESRNDGKIKMTSEMGDISKVVTVYEAQIKEKNVKPNVSIVKAGK